MHGLLEKVSCPCDDDDDDHGDDDHYDNHQNDDDHNVDDHSDDDHDGDDYLFIECIACWMFLIFIANPFESLSKYDHCCKI